MRKFQFVLPGVSVFLLGLGATFDVASAETAPDAGQTLRQLQQTPPQAPSDDRAAPTLKVPQAVGEAIPAGGERVDIRRFNWIGVESFSESELEMAILSVLEDYEAESTTTATDGGETKPSVVWRLDLAGLSRVSEAVTAFYRQKGFPFSLAVVPEQEIKDGQVSIVVFEGNYGETRVTVADPAWEARASKWMAPLEKGVAVRDAELTRRALLLRDLPGVIASTTLGAGTSPGSADVDVELQKAKRIVGEFGFANHGSRFSGENQARFRANINSPFMLGDQISITGLATQHELWNFGLNYSLPIGYNGWRAQGGYSETSYSLVKGFEGATGTAQVSTAGVSYPILRTLDFNIYFAGSWVGKRLNNNFPGGGGETYTVNTLPFTVSFDRRDGFGGGGVTYGFASWTPGDLNKPDPVRAGSFHKLNIDVSRIQILNSKFSLFGRLAAQAATQNLDSAEGFGVGGPIGVRAYPVGEAYGDEGWLAQVEARYAMGAYSPFVFYDHGRVRIDAKPNRVETPSPDQEIGGIGAGLRYEDALWRADATLAWRTTGGPPTSGTDRDPRALFSVSYKF
jgi:hemolysin activation/secretion protein